MLGKSISQLRRVWRMLDPVFPRQSVFARRLPLRQAICLFFLLAVIFSLAATLIPTGFVGFDWVHFWGIQRVPPFYPPWTIYLVSVLTFPVLTGLTLAAFSLAVIHRSIHPISAAAAFLCLPLMWTLFLGQLDGLVLLGVLGMPWLVPLALLKPQVSLFALGARRSFLIVLMAWVVLSLILWPGWLRTMLNVNHFYAEGRYQQDISLGLWGLPLFLITAWFSRGDMDMLMASGTFLTPHLIFYNLLPLTPAVARLGPRAAAVALVLSYLPLLSNWVDPMGWWLGWGFTTWIWGSLAARRYSKALLLTR